MRKALTTLTIAFLTLILLCSSVYAEHKIFPLTNKDSDVKVDVASSSSWQYEITASGVNVKTLGSSTSQCITIKRHPTQTWVPVDVYVFINFKPFRFTTLQMAQFNLIHSIDWGYQHTIVKFSAWDKQITIIKKLNNTDTNIKAFSVSTDNWKRIIAIGCLNARKPVAVVIYDDLTYETYASDTDVYYLPLYGVAMMMWSDVYTNVDTTFYNIAYADSIDEYINWLRSENTSHSISNIAVQIIPVVVFLACIGLVLSFIKKTQ